MLGAALITSCRIGWYCRDSRLTRRRRSGKMVVQSAPSAPAEQRITLRNVSWELYEQILEAHGDSSAPRFVYDRGDLEIMSPFPEHERVNWAIERTVETVADALDIDCMSLRSTTFKRADLDRG